MKHCPTSLAGCVLALHLFSGQVDAEPIRGRVMGAVSIAFNLGTFGGMWTGGAIALLGDVRWGMAAGPLGMLVIILSVLVPQKQIRKLADTT